MTPLTTHDQDGEDHRLASKVMTDAMVLNRYQLLKILNPDIHLVTEMMLPQNMAYLAPMSPVRGVHQRFLHLLSPAYISGSGVCVCAGLQEHMQLFQCDVRCYIAAAADVLLQLSAPNSNRTAPPCCPC